MSAASRLVRSRREAPSSLTRGSALLSSILVSFRKNTGINDYRFSFGWGAIGTRVLLPHRFSPARACFHPKHASRRRLRRIPSGYSVEITPDANIGARHAKIEASISREPIDELRAECGQLYDSWDKILADLEVAHREGETVYSEKLSTVRTHYVDVAAKKTEVSSDNKWVDVPASSYRAVENDLGMVIAHKDAGLFDSEAQNNVQPPGFAYIASPEQGSNQYGYWSHSGGQSVWTFLPEYLLMRELLWGHSYRPIYVNEYNGFQLARRSGQTYYGQETPASPPKYGSHGTFTAQRYANSRYVQSGGYAGSAYASNRAAAPSSRPESSFAPRGEDSSAGKRFGGSSGGEKFGSSKSGSSGGQRFGSPRPSPRMAPRGFGHRR